MSFDILEFQIEGNSVLSVEAIERAVMPFLGPGRQMDSVEAARGALEKAYQGAGYLTVFVDVPEQRVDGGVVVLNVGEGRVARLSVTGSRYFSQGYIRDKVPELADGKVPNFNEVQRQLALVNRTEDRRVQPVMRAGRTPGTVDTELKVEDRLPVGGSIEVNNRAAADTKPLRIAATARYDNLFQLDHSISLTASTAPEATQQSRVFSLTYTIPAADQSAWVGYVINSDSAVAAVGDVNVLGKGTTVGFRYVFPGITLPQQFHTVSVGFDYKNIKEDVRFGDGTISTPLHYLPFQLSYSGNIDHGPHAQTSLSLQVVTAFRNILRRTNEDCPGGPADQFACKRQGGDGGFATLRGDVRRSFSIGDGGSLHVRLGAQVSTGPLPSAEQYTIGGAESVRGYYEAEGAGDRAVLGSLEWRSPDLRGRFSASDSGTATSRFFTQALALTFVDVARAYTENPATGQAPRISLAGGGLGFRVKVGKATAGELDIAWPFKLTTATSSRNPRVHVRLSVDL